MQANPTIKESLIVQKEGNREVQRKVIYYNLDMIISVGYRVKSQRGIDFRIWATKVLKEYILRGYAISQRFERAVITILTTANYHDRFLIIDNTVYHIGASLKDLGKKLFAFSKMDIKPAELLKHV